MEQKRLDNKGVSLVELLVSIAIMGILAALVSVVLVSGTKFFRKQSAVTNLQNDSQIITTTITKALLEATDIKVENKTGYIEISTGDKIFAWVNQSGDANFGSLYIYGSSETLAFDKGHRLSKNVANLEIHGRCFVDTLNADGTHTYSYDTVTEASVVDAVLIDLSLSNSLAELKQSFEVKPRNSDVKYKEE